SIPQHSTTYNTSIIYYFFYFFFHNPATTELYTLSLHDALPISCSYVAPRQIQIPPGPVPRAQRLVFPRVASKPAGDVQRVLTQRSEEHTSELQSRGHLVCRLLLEKKKKN